MAETDMKQIFDTLLNSSNKINTKLIDDKILNSSNKINTKLIDDKILGGDTSNLQNNSALKIFENPLNKNLKSIKQKPDGEVTVDLHDDNELIQGIIPQLTPRPIKGATSPTVSGPVDVPEVDTSSGGIGDFFSNLLNNELFQGKGLPILLGQIAQAIDPNSPGGRLGGQAVKRSQAQLFNKLLGGESSPF